MSEPDEKLIRDADDDAVWRLVYGLPIKGDLDERLKIAKALANSRKEAFEEAAEYVEHLPDFMEPKCEELEMKIAQGIRNLIDPAQHRNGGTE